MSERPGKYGEALYFILSVSQILLTLSEFCAEEAVKPFFAKSAMGSIKNKK
jgi:hypothetical protein